MIRVLVIRRSGNPVIRVLVHAVHYAYDEWQGRGQNSKENSTCIFFECKQQEEKKGKKKEYSLLRIYRKRGSDRRSEKSVMPVCVLCELPSRNNINRWQKCRHQIYKTHSQMNIHKFFILPTPPVEYLKATKVSVYRNKPYCIWENRNAFWSRGEYLENMLDYAGMSNTFNIKIRRELYSQKM